MNREQMEKIEKAHAKYCSCLDEVQSIANQLRQSGIAQVSEIKIKQLFDNHKNACHKLLDAQDKLEDAFRESGINI